MDNAVRADADQVASAPDEPALVVVAEDSAPPDAGPAAAVVAPLVEPVLDSVLDHEGPWSEEDYRTLSATSIAHGDGRVELVDGALVIGPGPTPASDTAITHVRTALGAALPDGLSVLDAVPVRMGVDCVLVPDMVVTRTAPDGVPDAPLDADAVLMVVEIVGPEHGALDRSFKPQVYARSRVPYLLLVDHHAPYAAASMLIGGRFHEYAGTSGPDDLELEEPFRLRLPLRPA